MGAHDSLGTGYRPPSSKHIKPGASVKTEVHAILDTVGHLLLCGVNSVRSNTYPLPVLSNPPIPYLD